MREKTIFPSQFNLIWVVQSSIKKYFRSLLTQITCISIAVSSHRGAARDRHGRGAGCGGRGLIRRENVMAGQALGLVSDQTARGRMMWLADGEVVWS